MDNLQAIKQRFGIVGQSPLLDRALDTAIRVANTDLTVLITGESGVGKEVFSKIIHSLSARKHNKFIAINCGAIPEGTINSELFGHEKGAFTGATSDRKGYFETYDGGTIFLDEIGEMPLDTQSYLLRILESGEFIRVGSSNVLRTDVRIIAATNVDLKDRIRKNKFREDLYYRLNTVSIAVPALRDRPEDIFLLFRRFAVDFAERYRTPPLQLDERAVQLLLNHAWPGNIRELKNVAEKVSVMAENRSVTAEKLVEYVPALLERNLPMITSNGQDSGQSFQEREILYKVLFDMKNDLNDLKSLVFELIRNNNLRVPDARSLQALHAPSSSGNALKGRDLYTETDDYRNRLDNLDEEEPQVDLDQEEARPVIIQPSGNSSREPLPGNAAYGSVEVLDENLRLEDHEKTLIQRALRKHKGRRKDAADELGISERTLYRKIKQYDL
ncbi:MAG: sigma-54-dependent Fis family transcriptional regulator [Lewinellaceae bacterium]|nr:sigma-54-dependent Fis family transcriptional regulator [Lewinellaceae bacterium]